MELEVYNIHTCREFAIGGICIAGCQGVEEARMATTVTYVWV